MDRATLSEEDRVNAMRGYKAYVCPSIHLQRQTLTQTTMYPIDTNTCLSNSAINNPRVSEEAKQHARDVLDNELGGDAPSFAIYEAQDAGKEPTRVAGGLKA